MSAALHFRLDDPLNRALALNDLRVWISHARDITRRLEALADDPVGQEMMALAGIAYGSSTWLEPQQNGLDYFDLIFTEALQDVRSEVDADFDAARKDAQ